MQFLSTGILKSVLQKMFNFVYCLALIFVKFKPSFNIQKNLQLRPSANLKNISFLISVLFDRKL